MNNPGLPPPGEPVNFLTQLVSDAEFIDPRFLNEQPSNRLPSPESDPGDPPRVITVADAIAFVERGTTVESTYWQQRFEIGVPEAILEATHEATRQNKQKKLVRNCLKCRFEKKKVICPYNLELIRILSECAVRTSYEVRCTMPTSKSRRLRHAVHTSRFAVLPFPGFMYLFCTDPSDRSLDEDDPCSVCECYCTVEYSKILAV